jgi:hypothetical protein
MDTNIASIPAASTQIIKTEYWTIFEQILSSTSGDLIYKYSEQFGPFGNLKSAEKCLINKQNGSCSGKIVKVNTNVTVTPHNIRLIQET